jgi:hypothetical protein
MQRGAKGLCTASDLSVTMLLYTKVVETRGNFSVELWMMTIARVQELQLDSSFTRELPGDPEKANSLRQVIPMLLESP